MFDSLWPHGLQHARPLWLSLTPRIYSNSCPLSRWCHPTTLSCCPLLLPLSIFPSIRVSSDKTILHIRWPKYWSFSFSNGPSNEYSGLISFRIGWLDLLAVQRTLESLLQHHSSKESVLRHSVFFIVQLSHPYMFNSVQFSRVRFFATPWTVVHQASLSITNSRSSPKPMSIKSVMPSNHLILCRPLLLPSIFPSIRVFSNESALYIRWPKYWSFSFNISSSNEYLRLISFRMDWLDLLAVQWTLKSLLQHHSSKVSILLCSAFFIVQLSPP